MSDNSRADTVSWSSCPALGTTSRPRSRRDRADIDGRPRPQLDGIDAGGRVAEPPSKSAARRTQLQAPPVNCTPGPT